LPAALVFFVILMLLLLVLVWGESRHRTHV
jgi:hypothetical protein